MDATIDDTRKGVERLEEDPAALPPIFYP